MGVQQHILKQQQGQAQGRGGNDSNPKGDLSAALCLLLDRSATKDDCVYEHNELETKHGKKFEATLTISALTTERTEFKGKPADNKKDAEKYAAQKALNVLGKEIKEARKAKDEIDAEKRKAKAAEWKEKREAKKAEKEAEKA